MRARLLSQEQDLAAQQAELAAERAERERMQARAVLECGGRGEDACGVCTWNRAAALGLANLPFAATLPAHSACWTSSSTCCVTARRCRRACSSCRSRCITGLYCMGMGQGWQTYLRPAAAWERQKFCCAASLSSACPFAARRTSSCNGSWLRAQMRPGNGWSGWLGSCRARRWAAACAGEQALPRAPLKRSHAWRPE